MAKLEDLIHWPTPRDLAAQTGACCNTAYSWIWTRKVEAIQVMGSWRVNPKDVEKMRLRMAARIAKRTKEAEHDGTQN